MTTTPLGFPKPEGTDLISQGWDAIADLADALDAYLDPTTGWVTPALTNGWLSYDGGASFNPPGYRMIGPQVFLRGLYRSGTLNTSLFTLPVGLRPGKTQLLTATVASYAGSTDGTIDGGAYTAGANITNTSNASGHNHAHAHQHSISGIGVAATYSVPGLPMRLDIATTGTVTPVGHTTNAYLCLDGVSFFID